VCDFEIKLAETSLRHEAAADSRRRLRRRAAKKQQEAEARKQQINGHAANLVGLSICKNVRGQKRSI
jgi:hypothetical protein